MKLAEMAAQESPAKRRKVGAIAMTNNGDIHASGCNQMPPELPQECEDADGNTLPEVLHAEDVMLMNLECSPVRRLVSTVLVTKEPCARCAWRLMESLPGLRSVFYRDVSASRPDEGLAMLRLHGVETHRYVS